MITENAHLKSPLTRGESLWLQKGIGSTPIKKVIGVGVKINF